MSDAKNAPETIADICREMRAQIDCLATDPGYNLIHCRCAAEWARRIEAAAKRIVITDNSETLRNALTRIDELGDALSRVIEERDRLRAALLTICTADKTAEGLREIAIDACNGKGKRGEVIGFCNRNICPECGSTDCDLMNRIGELERENAELRECLREAVSEMCAAYCDERGLNCRKEQGKCFVQKWVNALAKAEGEEEK